MGNYIPLGEIEPYKTAVNIGQKCWKIYDKMDWQLKKIIGDQFIRAIDSYRCEYCGGLWKISLFR